MRPVHCLVALLGLLGAGGALAAAPTLVRETTIDLGKTSGRMDHLAIDASRRRLFVAEYGNNSVAVVDLAHGALAQRIGGLHQPQGLVYLAATDSLYVATGGDGLLHTFSSAALSPGKSIDLGDDTDNLRADPAAGLIYASHNQALAVIDARSVKKVADIATSAHPEGFELDAATPRIYANLPEAHAIAVVDRTAKHQTTAWPETVGRGNFPLELDDSTHMVLAAFRHPALLAAFDAGSGGALTSQTAICADADDIFLDRKRARVYVSCGAGEVALVPWTGGRFGAVTEIKTRPGARTSLFVPELDRLFVAVPGKLFGRNAEIWVFRPE